MSDKRIISVIVISCIENIFRVPVHEVRKQVEGEYCRQLSRHEQE